MTQPRLLRFGSTGTDVADWQRLLVRRGYTLHADGHFGRHTETSTRALQRFLGLTADGIVGPKTRAVAEAAQDPADSPRDVPKVATPLSEAELLNVLRAGHVAATGSEPSRARLACAWAHVALEHGRGRFVYCNNIGNITALGSWPGKYYVIRVQERVKRDPDVWKWMDLKFRAHATPEDGAADYWRLMLGRYASAVARFDAADPAGAALELSRLGFYTARAEHYVKAMASLYRECPE
ncbi:peptidoglycan-binding protein [Sorangium sp. So ce118]